MSANLLSKNMEGLNQSVAARLTPQGYFFRVNRVQCEFTVPPGPRGKAVKVHNGNLYVQLLVIIDVRDIQMRILSSLVRQYAEWFLYFSSR